MYITKGTLARTKTNHVNHACQCKSITCKHSNTCKRIHDMHHAKMDGELWPPMDVSSLFEPSNPWF